MEEIKEYKTKEGPDLNEFNQEKAKIEGYSKIEVESPYGEDGELLPNAQKRKTMVLKVVTEPITQVEDSEGNKLDIRASELFNMKEIDGEWMISSSPKSKIQKFLASLKVKKISNVIGKTVVIRSYENKSGNTFLGFMY